MADDSYEYEFLFRPLIRGRSRQADGYRMHSFRSSLLGKLRAFAKDASAPSGGGGSARYDIGETPLHSRRCVVKSHYVSMLRGGRVAAGLHLAYLERDGVERDGSPGRLYGADDTFDREAFAEPLKGERRQFRFIVSPEDARQVDLPMFARELVGQMERDLGRPLVWAAVNHHNTDRPHVHIVIRGVDGDGKELRIPPRYIQHDMRARAQHLLTRELGLRTDLEIARQRTQEIDQERLTSIDRTLAELLLPDGGLDPRDVARMRGDLRSTLLARLATLERLGLATRETHGAWRVVEGWQRDLSQLGIRNDVIKRLHQLAPGDPSRYRFLEPSELTAPVEGIVRGKGLHDELTGELFAAVETHSGETHYVRLERQVAEQVREGEVVRIAQTTESWIKPTDHVLARIAERNGGIYDPAVHLDQIAGAERKAVAPQDLIAGNLRRLERLERYGLVGRLPDGRWEIRSDLLQQLQAREATHPRHRLNVEYVGPTLQRQATYPGPTWLDRQFQRAPERASTGFGGELAAALKARAIYLLSLGLEVSSPDKAKKLDATERLLVGRRLAADLGATYHEGPSTVRGVLTACPRVPSGRAFACVVDERSKRLVLVPASVETSRLEGRRVEVTVSQDRRLVVRQARGLGRGED
jgi:type IV secretory pathway VirD2 relaxase